MNADQENLNQITERIIGAAYKVENGLGCGFLEKVYQNALAHELTKAGLFVEKEKSLDVYYDGIIVGEYIADLIVGGKVLVEVKAIRAFDEIHTAQCLNYLAATGLTICLLINFGKKVEIKRIVCNF
jgi:GxxExxY protein